ncbi:MAG: carbohydrate ABC transporter permease [Huintestinicola sp.]|uniref:carbohydrate ABC transporter permease n=1 Tax=Huintestinicola sp. TaxID=2981661 RepID=UPI003F01568C
MTNKTMKMEQLTRPKLSKSYVEKMVTVCLFLLIPTLLLVVFTYIPAAEMVKFSFEERDQFGVNVKFVGLENYKTVFSTPEYFAAFKNSIYYLVGSFTQLALALFIATILCSKIRFANFFKGVVFFPYMINTVAVALIFRRFFQKGDGITNTDGTLNSIIALFGGDPVKFLSTEGLVNICLVFVSIWRYIGFDIVMFIGAIQSISPDIYEAADLDGANRFQVFRYIIAPGIRPIILLQMILAVKGAISVYEIPFIITGGRFGSSTFVIQTTETAFKFQKVGLASAMAVVLFLIIVIVTVIQKLVLKEEK